jgi:ribosome-associated protein
MSDLAADLELYDEREDEFGDEFDEDETDETGGSEMSSEEKVRLMAEAAYSLKATDIKVLDLRELTIIADFFLFCTGNSSIQIRSIADRIEERLREQGERKHHIEGFREATWILLDYGDVVAHVMEAEQREHFNLEGFWDKAPRLELDLPED